MEQNTNINPVLWKAAQERAGFKIHFVIYFIVIAFLWILWAFLGYINDWEYSSLWPVYPMFGWGLGLLFHYFAVYRWNQKLIAKEYEKLVKKEITNQNLNK